MTAGVRGALEAAGYRLGPTARRRRVGRSSRRGRVRAPAPERCASFATFRNPGRFVSFGQWDHAEAIRRWKSSPEFKERLGRVVKQASEFESTELVTLAKVTGGSLEVHSPPTDIEAIHAPS